MELLVALLGRSQFGHSTSKHSDERGQIVRDTRVGHQFVQQSINLFLLLVRESAEKIRCSENSNFSTIREENK